ncbi:MAG: radical SAM protein [Mailhella sp.]|nr:radical SAM protein [Mailhella sp.]
MAADGVFAGLRGPGIWETVRELFVPRELECLQVGVTSCCPGRCTYCPHTTHASEWNARHMAPETYAALWPVMRRAARVHLQGWGEPMLNPHFFDFVRLARRADCSVSTTTCGLRMDGRIAEEIVRSGLDIVAFSLAGTDDASNASRAGVPFAQVEKAVRLLQDIRTRMNGVHLEIHLAYLMLASNVEAVRRLPEIMDEWGVHAAVVSTMDYIPSSEMAAEAFAPHERGKIEAARKVLEDVAVRVRASGRSFYASLPAENPAPCCRERAHKTLYADADGSISPCVYLNVPFAGGGGRRAVFGNAVSTPVEKIWEKPLYAEFRSRLGTDDPPEVCRGCAKRFEAPCAER